MEINFTIPIQPVTKKNSVRVVRNRNSGRTIVLPSEAFLTYQDTMGFYLKEKWQEHSEPCNVKALFYMGTHRKVDLTNLLEALDDCLVHYKVLSDDNSSIIVSHDGSRVLYDREHPRTEVTITWED